MTSAPSDTWKLARKLLGSPDPDRGDWYWRRRRSPRKWDELVRQNWRAIWDSGEVAYRSAVLMQVGKHRIPGLWELCWEALEEPDYYGMLHGMAMVYVSSEVRRQTITQPLLETLLSIIRTDADDNTRLLGLTVLEWQSYPGLVNLLRELAHDRSPQMAFEVNFRLALLGDDTADALLGRIPFLRYADYEIRRVWRMKSKLRLTGAQQQLAMRLMTREATKARHKFWQFPEHPDVRTLHEFLELGVPPEEGDIDDIGRAVFTYKESRREHSTGKRIEFVRAVAWFANDRARDWLRAIRDSEVLPKTVRTAAKRELRKLEATPRRG